MEERLNEIIGNQYNYCNKIFLIKSWKKVNVSYVIITDKRTFNFYENELVSFLDKLQPVRVKLKDGILEKRQLELKNMENTPNVRTVSNESTDLSEILLDTIKKVQSNKEYIGQANAICNVVSQMINIKKLELQLKNK